MRRCIVLVTAVSFLFTQVLNPLAYSHEHGGGNKLKGEAQANNAPGTDVQGNATTEGELGSIFFKGVLNTKTGKGRVKGKGETENLSAKKQIYKNDIVWLTFFIAILLVMFGLDDVDALDFAAIIASNGKVRVKGTIDLEGL